MVQLGQGGLYLSTRRDVVLCRRIRDLCLTVLPDGQFGGANALVVGGRLGEATRAIRLQKARSGDREIEPRAFECAPTGRNAWLQIPSQAGESVQWLA
jgi:hypothetical protein